MFTLLVCPRRDERTKGLTNEEIIQKRTDDIAAIY